MLNFIQYNLYQLLRHCSETVIQRCSVKKVFLEILQIHRKAPVPESLFLIKLQESFLIKLL